MQFNIKRKILGLTVLASALPILLVLGLILFERQTVVGQIENELNRLARANIAQITSDVYRMCQLTNNGARQRLAQHVQAVKDLLDRKGRAELDRRLVRWPARHAVTRQPAGLTLPLLTLGGREFLPSGGAGAALPLADEFRKFQGISCSIYQLINENGDMLRIAGRHESGETGPAAVLLFPAAEHPACPAGLLPGMLAGHVQFGIERDGREIFASAYLPLADQTGRITGMMGIRMELPELQELRQIILRTKVGTTGYVSILGGQGAWRGHYIISKDGLRDGENIWELKDSDGRLFIQSVIERTMALPEGEVLYDRYQWRNAGEETARMKVTACTYFRPWDWIIGAGTYEDDYYEAKSRAEEMISNLLAKSSITGIGVLVLLLFLASVLVTRLVRPLRLIAALAKTIAGGDIQEAKRELAPAARLPVEEKRRRYFHPRDESDEVLEAFRTMTGDLDSLIGQVHTSSVQINSSATEIGASARELSHTVKAQSDTTNDVLAVTSDISRTAEELVKTTAGVGGDIASAAAQGETGKASLERMEDAMRRLVQATASISSRLAAINQKAATISTVVNTITKISDRTELLSLNAAIEAEKAGDYGKGFSVVAREISRLADQTAAATQDIEHIVREMEGTVTAGVMEMDKFAAEVRQGGAEVAGIGRELSGIIDRIRTLGPKFQKVADGMQIQSAGAQQIRGAMQQLAGANEQTRESFHEFERVSVQLNEAIAGLQSEVARFKVSG